MVAMSSQVARVRACSSCSSLTSEARALSESRSPFSMTQRCFSCMGSSADAESSSASLMRPSSFSSSTKTAVASEWESAQEAWAGAFVS